jgi:hypothetical protein
MRANLQENWLAAHRAQVITGGAGAEPLAEASPVKLVAAGLAGHLWQQFGRHVNDCVANWAGLHTLEFLLQAVLPKNEGVKQAAVLRHNTNHRTLGHDKEHDSSHTGVARRGREQRGVRRGCEKNPASHLLREQCGHLQLPTAPLLRGYPHKVLAYDLDAAKWKRGGQSEHLQAAVPTGHTLGVYVQTGTPDPHLGKTKPKQGHTAFKECTSGEAAQQLARWRPYHFQLGLVLLKSGHNLLGAQARPHIELAAMPKKNRKRVWGYTCIRQQGNDGGVGC